MMKSPLLLLLLGVGAVQAQVADDLSERDRQTIRALDADIEERENVISSMEAKLEDYLAALPADESARTEWQQTRLREMESGVEFMQEYQEALVRRRQELVEGQSVANTFARAVDYIFYPNFEADSVLDRFSDAELQILRANSDALNSMIRAALGWQDSIGGAKLMAHLGLRENFDYLRSHMLEPGRTYGWEGLYTSDEERYYADGQYVYHSQYLAAIEELMGAPLHEVIELTERERQRIDDLVADANHESHHWAIWISRKLEL
jgi:hypothetical protein